MTVDDELAALEARIEQLSEPSELLALAAEVDALGGRLATELVGLASEPQRAALIKPVLARVPAVHVRVLLRVAERYDDLGSPRRAAYVLLEGLRKAFAADTIATVAAALAFILDAHGDSTVAARVRALATTTGEPGASRRELRARFLATIDELRAAIDWNALDDELGLD